LGQLEAAAMSETAAQPALSSNSRPSSLWVRELPFSLVLILTILGVAYTSFSRQPIIGYWEILAPIIGVMCVATGWHNATDKAARLRLVVTQALHWLAFLAVMNMLLLPSVQKSFSTNAMALAIFTLLTLGTFTAGVHVFSWQICLLGLLMALAIPAMAWIENSALIFGLIAVGILGIIVVFWWLWRERRERSESAG
jgi:Flp pilus assembly protein TadB